MTGSTPTVVQYGVGPIGAEIAALAVDRGFDVVGAIDIDPEKVGRELGDVLEGEPSPDVTITDDPSEALDANPDLVFHATGSALTDVAPQLETCLARGVTVVSTAEELSYPWRTNAEVAEDLDTVARRGGATLLGTGINPGFAMDLLPTILSLPCRRVESVTVRRLQDAGTRREPLQRKIGCGQSVETFDREVRSTGGHVGLEESTAMLAAGLGWDLDRFEMSIDPVVASEPRASDVITVDPGQVAGIVQEGIGYVDGESRLRLELEMTIGAESPYDVVEIAGVPALSVRTVGGFHGDVTTPALVVNAARGALTAEPGLYTVLDLPPGNWRGGSHHR